jgi:uncharacterized protein (DUF849 family)
MNDKAVITCALTGVLTDPKQHHVPVTPEEMAREAKAAFDAGAAVMHVHFRQQGPGKGHLPSWEPELAVAIMQAIRDACPGVILNETTGTMGPDISGPLACLRAVKPEIAACNAGSLNYLKVRSDGSWAWPPHLFDNPVEKVNAYLEVMRETGTQPEFECFDVDIVRCVGMYAKNGMFAGRPKYNFVTEAHHRRRPVAGHRDRPRRHLAAAPPGRRTRRPSAHRPRRHLLSARRQQDRLERRARGHAGALCARRRPCRREPRRGAWPPGP